MNETETVFEVTDLESPIDPKIRRGLEIKLKKTYGPRLEDKTKPWGIAGNAVTNHRDHPEFRKHFYKFFVTTLLIRKSQPGEKNSVNFIRNEIERTVGGVDPERFTDAVNTIYMYLTDQLPLSE